MRFPIKLRLLWIGLCAALFVNAPAALAQLSVEPLFLEIRPGESAAIRARNTSDAPMTLEMTIESRNVDRQGAQTRTSADDDFVLIPPQAVVPPQGSQVFRLQALPTGSAESQSYFMTVRQLPVAMGEIDGGGAQLQIVFAFDVAVHVVPRGAEARSELLAASLSTMQIAQAAVAESGAAAQEGPATDAAQPTLVEVPAVAITVRNVGTKFLYLQDLDYIATGIDTSGARVNLPAWQQPEIVDAAGVTLVEPGAERMFKLPLRDAPALSDIKVEIRRRAQV